MGTRREGADGMKWETMLDQNTLLCAKQRASGNYSIAQGAQLGVLR